jgi:hypothetical protein
LDGFDDWAEEYDVIDPAHLKLHQREEEQDLSVDEVLALDPDELDRYLTASKSESSLRSYVQDLRKAQRKAVKAAAKAAA